MPTDATVSVWSGSSGGAGDRDREAGERPRPSDGAPAVSERLIGESWAARIGLYPIVIFQYRSTTLYQISHHIQYLFS